uniref:Uncharacterized protein n=1 Tax=Ditylum brightwellii TaxID=49249 RepID=A0A7S1ZHG8_9STRA|mmetsp:Transcript_31783/g.47398  ORF Transcript_31783/g.47398 Transcript_31783/m.47398 type:complete len:294 (+) Transcript_31783:2-883(+)
MSFESLKSVRLGQHNPFSKPRSSATQTTMMKITNRNKPNDLLVDWPGSSERTDGRRTSFNKSHLYETDSSSKVRFSHATKVRFIETSDDEFSARWYAGREYARIKNSATTTIIAMRRATSQGIDVSSVNSKSRCIRGLENQSSESLVQERIMERASGKRAVLIEQSFQRKSGINNPVAIAQAYMSFSKTAKERAAKYGKEDAEDAAQVQEGTGTIANMTRCETSADVLKLQNLIIAQTDIKMMETLDGVPAHPPGKCCCIRDPSSENRIESVCENNPSVPEGDGKEDDGGIFF